MRLAPRASRLMACGLRLAAGCDDGALKTRRGRRASGPARIGGRSRRRADGPLRGLCDPAERKGVRRRQGECAGGITRRRGRFSVISAEAGYRRTAHAKATRPAHALRPTRRVSSEDAMALEARSLIEPPAPHGPRMSWVGPGPHGGTPAPTDGWPHPGDDAPTVKEISSPERGSRAVAAEGVPHVRRRTCLAEGGRRSDGRLTLQKPILCGAGGILLLLLPFIDGVLGALAVKAVREWEATHDNLQRTRERDVP